ncbi:MAG: EscU/YscU/HrcU family type III secretion system export apparatus switch protein, partial [Bdellovibrionales bacterium]|nr:EscU/YscU/HrcU family type III secretion system export apparatus switch protein [Bdellovibrionales bacterium]
TSARDGGWLAAVKFAGLKSLLIVGPIFGIMSLISFSATLVQTGILQNEDALKFNIERLNPVEGLKRIFSLRAWVEGLKAIVKVIIIGAVATVILRSEILVIPRLVDYSVEQILVYIGMVSFKLFVGIGALMAALAGFDYLFQRWELEKKMRMSKQEVKEETKSREGDPLIKARIRRIQREMANRRMMDAIPKADVIITNPTHIAVALQYDENTVAPRVVAKGADYLAEKIKEIARQHNITIVENKPLARAMYKTLKIGQVIPRELYTAVAEVLSYVFKLKKKVIQ